MTNETMDSGPVAQRLEQGTHKPLTPAVTSTALPSTTKQGNCIICGGMGHQDGCISCRNTGIHHPQFIDGNALAAVWLRANIAERTHVYDALRVVPTTTLIEFCNEISRLEWKRGFEKACSIARIA